MIKRKDTLGEIISKNPEVASVLGKAGLHCIGCHVSAYESIEDGCKAHGMNDKEIDELVKEANKKVLEVDKLGKVSLTKMAVLELEERMKKAKGKYVKIIPIFDGYDFDVVSKKEKNDIEIDAGVKILLDVRTERILRGIIIDFDKKQNDFVAKKK
jgi:hybrid cluster-associated redox disulfide protein